MQQVACHLLAIAGTGPKIINRAEVIIQCRHGRFDRHLLPRLSHQRGFAMAGAAGNLRHTAKSDRGRTHCHFRRSPTSRPASFPTSLARSWPIRWASGLCRCVKLANCLAKPSRRLIILNMVQTPLKSMKTPLKKVQTSMQQINRKIHPCIKT